MRIALKIVWKLLQIALLVVPYVVAYFSHLQATYAGGFTNFYLIASAVALGLVVLMGWYDDYAEEEPGTVLATLKFIVWVAVAVFGFVGFWSGQNFTPSLYLFIGCTFFASLALYFLYMLFPFFKFEIFFTLVAVIPAVFLLGMEKWVVEYESVEKVHTICGIAAGGAFVLFLLFHKLMEALSDKIGSRTKYVEYDAVLRAVTAFNNQYRGKYTAGVQVSGSTIYVTLADNHGGKAYGSDAAKLKTFLQGRLHVNIDNSNVRIHY